MARLAPFIAAGLLAGCATAPVSHVEATPQPSRRLTAAKVLRSSVRVTVFAGGEARRAASGVVIDSVAAAGGPVTYVITNEHVVDPQGLDGPTYAVMVDGEGGTKQYAATVLAQGAVPGLDLALLSVQGVRLDSAVMAGDDELVLGQDLIAVGAPFGRGLSVSGGMLSQVEYGERREPSMLKTDAAIGYGDSGGGLFSVDTGHLLGIIEGYRTAQVQIPTKTETYSFDVPMPGETFAAPVAKLRRLLAEHRMALAGVALQQATAARK